MQFSYFYFGVGQVTIDLFIEKETNFIVLHIQDLNVTEKVSLAVIWLQNCKRIRFRFRFPFVVDCVSFSIS